MTRRHVVISGTGRSGTTFLVQLLTRLGCDTGFSERDIESEVYTEGARAGLEHDLRKDNSPYIVKNPWFCDYAKEVLSRDDIVIEHIFIPMRDLHAAAESRRYVVKAAVARMSLRQRIKYALNPEVIPGGLWHTHSGKIGRQEEALLQQVYALLLTLSDTAIPVTFLRYPRIVEDSRYLFEKLSPILGKVTYEKFAAAFAKTVRPDLVHSFSAGDRHGSTLPGAGLCAGNAGKEAC